MTKFTFRLESILSIKLKLEEQAKMEFGAAKMKLSEEQDKLEGLYNKKSGYENDLKKLYSEDLDIKRINGTARAIEIVDEQIKLQKYAVKRAEKQVDLATQKLNTVMQERKSMEKLKEKRFAEYMREYNEEESKQTDELISYQYGRVEE
ncbi:MAG: flagellar export protein FliJ [Lachnospiraceae bacterium]|jgi:flagellar FliJ protein|nr:flagellar export protein FliJ [Lachnospiraceae bacterium]MBQ6026315.1 flagellar export protein FliJ [Lachnospiraceae bacterium]MBR3484216.1 flagellar export protein FliJ [Lachnospiraceae bacterium]MBR3580286.1 flagellar export protein FliJ [Lachnospiraceae bacterium]MBR4542110.1 flagellar export protein FliJ [Lachnospiraceae bacterium]